MARIVLNPAIQIISGEVGTAFGATHHLPQIRNTRIWGRKNKVTVNYQSDCHLFLRDFGFGCMLSVIHTVAGKVFVTPKKKQSWKTAVIAGGITIVAAVLGSLNDAFNLRDRFFPPTTPTSIVQSNVVASNDIVLSTFPFFVGNTWEYSFGTRTDASVEHPEANEIGKYTAKVVNVETIEGKARVFYIEVSPPASNYAGFVFNAPCGSATDTKITYMVLTDGRRLYEECDRLKLVDIASKLLSNPENPPAGVVYKLPLTEGDHWGYSLDFPSTNDTFFQWYVEPKTDITVPAGTFKDCYKISFRTNPDITTHIVCPGIGLVASEYHHFGSIVDYRAELTSYNFTTQAK